MSIEDPYDDSARERVVAEPPKRVEAPVRLPFERDRARVVHAAASRRLAAKTHVVGPQTYDFVPNRLTHRLEVAEVDPMISVAIILVFLAALSGLVTWIFRTGYRLRE